MDWISVMSHQHDCLLRKITFQLFSIHLFWQCCGLAPIVNTKTSPSLIYNTVVIPRLSVGHVAVDIHPPKVLLLGSWGFWWCLLWWIVLGCIQGVRILFIVVWMYRVNGMYSGSMYFTYCRVNLSLSVCMTVSGCLSVGCPHQGGGRTIASQASTKITFQLGHCSHIPMIFCLPP